jgi:23S rRNA pseudouridine1911/1915/1917 synthase
VIVVPAEAAGERLDQFLAGQLGSRAAATRAVAAGALLDGRARLKSHRLEGGERIELAEPLAVVAVAVEQHLQPRVVWSDDELAVVDKPAGLVVHPGAARPSGTLVDALAGILGGGEEQRRGIVHRLDRDTSGLLVVARNEETHRALSGLVRRRELERVYLALVQGVPRSRAGRIEAPLGRDRDDPTRISLDTDVPRAAVTHFELVGRFARHSLLRVRLETGRTHQIRVHLAAIGLPVVGDSVYGVTDAVLGRQFLHAAHLGFTHPHSGERLELDAPLPPELQSYLDALG